MRPFNADPYLHAEVGRLIGKWGIGTAFETGTYNGHTTLALSLLCGRVFTVEIDRERLDAACLLFEAVGERGEIVADLGSSAEVLRRTIPEAAGERCLFYLDAHWRDYWPLCDELGAIADGIDGAAPVIVIHDFKVPGRPDLGYDSYGGRDLDFDHVRDGLDAVYRNRGGYRHHHNRLAAGARRGVLFVEPACDSFREAEAQR